MPTRQIAFDTAYVLKRLVGGAFRLFFSLIDNHIFKPETTVWQSLARKS